MSRIWKLGMHHRGEVHWGHNSIALECRANKREAVTC